MDLLGHLTGRRRKSVAVEPVATATPVAHEVPVMGPAAASASRSSTELPKRGFIGLPHLQAASEPILVEVLLDGMDPKVVVSLTEAIAQSLAYHRSEYLASGRVLEIVGRELQYLTSGLFTLKKDSPVRGYTSRVGHSGALMDGRDLHSRARWATKVGSYLSKAAEAGVPVTVTYCSSGFEHWEPRRRTRTVLPVSVDAEAGTALVSHYGGFRTYRLEQILSLRLTLKSGRAHIPVSKLVILFDRNFSVTLKKRRFLFYVAEAGDPTPTVAYRGAGSWGLANLAVTTPHVHSNLETETLVNAASLGEVV